MIVSFNKNKLKFNLILYYFVLCRTKLHNITNEGVLQNTFISTRMYRDITLVDCMIIVLLYINVYEIVLFAIISNSLIVI